MLKKAGKAEILRSQQKDEHYLNSLRSSVAEVCQSLAGARAWIKWRKELDILSDLGYFVLTTLSGLQTVGEEYVNLIQVESSKRQLPAFSRRTFMVLLHVCSPYLFERTLKNFESNLQSRQYFGSPQLKEQLLKIIPVIRQCFLYLHRFHLGLFYLRGVFYHIAKRFTGVQYIQYGNRTGDVDQSSTTFKLLSMLCLSQLALTMVIHSYNFMYSFSKQNEDGLIERSYSNFDGTCPAYKKCSLCLESRIDSTLTPCGHLFCWMCIHSWLQTKNECPLCRDQFPPHRLVCLKNLDLPPDKK